MTAVSISSRTAGVLQTLAVAVAFQFGAGVAESLALGGIGILRRGDVARTIVSVIIGIAASGCAGYFAARMRPAAPVMGAIVLAVVVVLMLTRGDAAPLWYQLVFLTDWRSQKVLLVQLAEAMPAEKFTYRPTPAQRTYGEQIVHIAVGSVAQMRVLGDDAADSVQQPRNLRGRVFMSGAT